MYRVWHNERNGSSSCSTVRTCSIIPITFYVHSPTTRHADGVRGRQAGIIVQYLTSNEIEQVKYTITQYFYSNTTYFFNHGVLRLGSYHSRDACFLFISPNSIIFNFKCQQYILSAPGSTKIQKYNSDGTPNIHAPCNLLLSAPWLYATNFKRYLYGW